MHTCAYGFNVVSMLLLRFLQCVCVFMHACAYGCNVYGEHGAVEISMFVCVCVYVCVCMHVYVCVKVV